MEEEVMNTSWIENYEEEEKYYTMFYPDYVYTMVNAVIH